MLRQLRQALRNERLVLHYQPKVELVTGEPVAAEALVRWEHPRLGMIGPDHFVPALEESSLVDRFNRYVLDLAVRQARSWQLAGRPLAVAVNLAPRSLDDAALPSDIERLLVERQLPPHLLRLEITERAFHTVSDRGREAMRRFSAMGLSVALDDFGIGYSSMARLVSLPMDVIKIDRTLVTPMATDERSLVVVRAAIDIAHSLGLKAVAEGVESAEVWQRLQGLGCDLAQGFFISHPMPPAELARRLFAGEAGAPHATALVAQTLAYSERRVQSAQNLAVRGMIDRLDWVAHSAAHPRPDELRRSAASAAGGARVALRRRCPR